MIKSLKKLAYALVAATSAALILVATERVVSHALMSYAIKLQKKSHGDHDDG